MFTWTHPSKADRGQLEPGSHTVLLAQHSLQIKFSLSSRTICWDTPQGLQLHCIFLSLSATKILQKSSFTPRWEFKGRRSPQLWPQRSFRNKVKYTQAMAFQNWQWRTVSTNTDNVSSIRRFSQWKHANRRYLSLLGRNWNLSAEVQGIFWFNYKLSTDLCRGDLIKLGKIKGKTGGGVPDFCFT